MSQRAQRAMLLGAKRRSCPCSGFCSGLNSERSEPGRNALSPCSPNLKNLGAEIDKALNNLRAAASASATPGVGDGPVRYRRRPACCSAQAAPSIGADPGQHLDIGPRWAR